MTAPPQNPDQSPFERRAYFYLEQGYSVIPIAPGTKKPGAWSEEHGWRGMPDWAERFGQRQATDIELEFWNKWPGAGLGLVCGKLSRIVALDRDYDVNGTDALEKIIPYTPVKKRGAKGYTAFYRYNGEASCSFNIGGARVLDVLSDGRQTLMPGTIHPDGHAYVYLTEDTLEEMDAEQLPMLPAGFLEHVAKVLAPYQTDEDREFRQKPKRHADTDQAIDTELSIGAAYFSEINQTALDNLELWVPRLVQGVRKDGNGYRACATWRNVKNWNVGVHPSGIFDFGGNYGMTAIDLVMYANQITFQKAAEALRSLLPLAGGVTLSMDAVPAAAPVASWLDAVAPAASAVPATEEAAAPAPAAQLMPWQMPTPVHQAPEPVMLPPTSSVLPAPALPQFIMNAPGILGEVARWITATAPKRQPELSLAAAIALCSVVMARTYTTDNDNWTSLFVIMVARSTEGKEHPQQCVDRVLSTAGLGDLVGGSGYTSSGALFSQLLSKPAHIVMIDEIGKMLKTSRAKGNTNGEAMLDKLVEAYGKPGGILRPPTYSTMTAPKGAAKMLERVVSHPAITMLGATTPGTFYDNLTSDLIHDGFLGRCLVVQSAQPRQLTRFVERAPPPARVIEWCKSVHVTGVLHGDLVSVVMPEEEPRKIVVPFTDGCREILQAFELELNEEKDRLESERMDVLLGRTQEKAMRLALIACKAESPDNTVIEPRHVQWAISYVRHYDSALVRAMREERTENEHDAALKRLVGYVRGARSYSNDKRYGELLARGEMPYGKLLGLMKLPSRQLRELCETAVESGRLQKAPALVGGDTFTIPA